MREFLPFVAHQLFVILVVEFLHYQQLYPELVYLQHYYLAALAGFKYYHPPAIQLQVAHRCWTKPAALHYRSALRLLVILALVHQRY